MAAYFGAQQADPQGVVIKDDSTGFLGFGRNTVTATSIISDTVWGLALPEIWCNSGGNPLFAYLATALMVDYRDESGYADSLGILGAGPLGGFTASMVVQNADGYRYVVAPMVDGYLWQGLKIDGNLNVTKYQPGMGLRYIPGNDRANPADSFSLGQGTPQVWEPNIFAAGTAACEIRIVKSTTIQPSTPDQHQMTVPLDCGLWGWAWDQNGNRTAVKGVVNPFWIAVNMLLRALGLYGDPSTGSNPAGGSGPASSDQLASFVLPSLVVGDGSGAAEIAAAQVPAILGSGTETQFQFQGVISSQKPFRDWLAQVLDCCLGFYTWEFGKLKLGCRINASAVDAYTAANMLFQSLRLTPIQAAFEHMVLSFADVAYQYQANTAEYCDKSHAAYYGRAGSPLTTQRHSAGISTLSQALRIAATLVREEIGGVNPTEWRNARCATWGTTLLGLGNEVGQVVSLTHSDVPGGTGKFRILRWSLKKDWSVQIEAQTVTDSMYDLDVGPKPIDVTPAPLPGLYYQIPLAPAWAPYQVQAPANDALFPGEWTFDCDQEYTTLADGSALASLLVTGKLPVNEFSASGAGAPGIGSVLQSPTGGSLPANVTLRVALCALDANGIPSAPSSIAIVGTSGSGTDTFTLNHITWPAVTGLTSWVLFVSTQDDLICMQASGALTATGVGTTYTPGSITFGGPVVRSTWALPSPYVSKIRIKAKLGINHGVAGVQVSGVAPNTITSSYLVGSTFNPTGRIVSVIGRQSGSTPFASFTITAFNSATGAMTVTPDPSAIVQAGDAVVIRNTPDAPNTSNPTQITDSGYKNQTFNNGNGLIPNALVGALIRVIKGTGRGTPPRKITANTAISIFWDLPLPMDETSVWITEEATWPFSADSSTIDNASPTTPVTINIPVDNYVLQPVVVAGFTVDSNGNESPDGDAPIREDWIYGAQGVRTVTAAAGAPELPTDGTIKLDGSAGPFTWQCLPAAQHLNAEVFYVKVTSDANPITVLAASGESFTDGTTSFTLVNAGDNETIKFHG